MLHWAWNIEHLSLKLDKASIEEWSLDLQEPEELWQLQVANLRYWNLQTLKLSGFLLENNSLQKFLCAHQSSLSTVHLDNCDLDGSWLPIFQMLRKLPELRKLSLHQISECMIRVLWINPEDVILVDNKKDGWVHVMFGLHHHFMLGVQDTATEWDALSDRLRVSRRYANPFAEDAVSWWPDFLNW